MLRIEEVHQSITQLEKEANAEHVDEQEDVGAFFKKKNENLHECLTPKGRNRGGMGGARVVRPHQGRRDALRMGAIRQDLPIRCDHDGPCTQLWRPPKNLKKQPPPCFSHGNWQRTHPRAASLSATTSCLMCSSRTCPWTRSRPTASSSSGSSTQSTRKHSS